MKLAIVGGGFLGGRVAREVSETCVVVTRSSRAEPPRPHVQMHALDITAEGLDPGPLAQCDHLLIAVATGGQDRRTLYVEGTTRLLEATRSIPWRRIVYVSSTSALPDRDAWLFEDELRRPSSERGAVQRDAEDIVLKHATTHTIPTIVLRLGGLYGPGRDLGRVYRRRREGPLPGDGHTPTNLIHVDDAVQACRAALQAPPQVGGVVHVCDDDHRCRRTMYTAVARAQDIEPVQWEKSVQRGAAPRGKRVSNLRMKLDLGVRLRHPHHDP